MNINVIASQYLASTASLKSESRLLHYQIRGEILFTKYSKSKKMYTAEVMKPVLVVQNEAH